MRVAPALRILCLLCPLWVWGQPLRTDIPLLGIDGVPLPHAWAGGLNAPQFSNLDLDGDGVQDLFVFDRADNSLMLFLQKGQPGQDSLVYAPLYRSRFPTHLTAWALLRDANCDGRPDLFTHNTDLPSTIWLYHQAADGTFPGPPLSLRSSYQGFGALLYSSLTDIPGLADIDGDGDLDILAFEVVSGEQVIWHRNFAMEDLGRCDTLLLRAQTDCFGRFLEDYDPTANTFGALLDQDCANYGKTSHIGGALLPVNLNGDSLMDLLVSDVGPRTLLALTNGGTRIDARFVSAEDNYPQADVPVVIDYFPGMFWVDMDADNVPDLVCAPNEAAGVQDRDGVWAYTNAGRADSLVPQLHEQGWLQHTQPDVGTGAMPTWADVDGDGLVDLLLAQETAWQAPAQTDCFVQYYRNTGTATSPAFTLTQARWLSQDTHPALAGCGWKPTLATLHADGRRTLVLGNLAGTLALLESAPNPGANPEFTLINTNWLQLDQLTPQPTHSQPLFADVDSDGDMDLIIGTARGRLVFYENTGSAGSPSFQWRSSYWGRVWVRDAQHPILGYASPALADLDGNGSPELLVGNRSGHLLVYRNLSTSSTALFDSLGPLFPEPVGTFIRPAIASLYQGQDSMSLLMGGQRGGLHLAKLGRVLNLSRATQGHSALLQVYPNPATIALQVRAPQPFVRLIVYNGMGQVITQVNCHVPQTTWALSLEALPAGIYTLQAQLAGGGSLSRQWVRQ